MKQLAKPCRRNWAFNSCIQMQECTYFANEKGTMTINLILYIDNLLIMGNSIPMIHNIKKQLKAAYQMKDLGAATSYLGIWITRDWKQRSIWINQENYIHNALTHFNLLNANDTKTPHPEGVHLVAATEPMPLEKLAWYQQLIRTLLYTSIGTYPDIAFTVTRLSRYNTNPMDEHHRYAQYILKYLKGTIKTQILYDGSSHARLIGYSDSDWCENKDDRHSTSRQVFTLANSTISWHSRQQRQSHYQWQKQSTWNLLKQQNRQHGSGVFHRKLVDHPHIQPQYAPTIGQQFTWQLIPHNRQKLNIWIFRTTTYGKKSNARRSRSVISQGRITLGTCSQNHWDE